MRRGIYQQHHQSAVMINSGTMSALWRLLTQKGGRHGGSFGAVDDTELDVLQAA